MDNNNNNNNNNSLVVGEVSAKQQEDAAAIEQAVVKWSIVATSNNPSPRFDNTMSMYKNHLYLFGGHQGENSTSSFSYFQKLDLNTFAWQSLPCTSVKTRILHTSVIQGDSMYIFGGCIYEEESKGWIWGASKTNKFLRTLGDLIKYDFTTNEWHTLQTGQARDGHCSVVANNEMYVIGGSVTQHDAKRNIFSTFFNCANVYNFETNTWREIPAPTFGRLGTAVTYRASEQSKEYVYYFGGYDQAGRSNNDLWRLDTETEIWHLVGRKEGAPWPVDRHSHTANIYQDKMYVYGGYNKRGFVRDLYAFDFSTESWQAVPTEGPPKRRRCNSVVLESGGRNRLLLFGGTYLSCYYNDIYEFVFPSQINIPKDRLAFDFSILFDNAQEYFSDITFVVEGRPIHAHKNILSVRSSYFKSMLTSGLKESFEKEIVIKNETFSDFNTMIRYVYTGDESLVTVENCIALLHLADCYMFDRLKTICEAKATEAIDVDSVVSLYRQADFYKLTKLRQLCITFIAKNHKDVLATGTLNNMDSSFLLEVMYCLDPSLNQSGSTSSTSNTLPSS
ncbi:hypothetical protein SAMD00019534_071930, partial [Acytostelium subglobosum LB1]|uniref:hypothetical protein n=1 Tax=Acytostelium subglobosum LB1 TaxID=1410327 RepID=UPI000644A94A